MRRGGLVIEHEPRRGRAWRRLARLVGRMLPALCLGALLGGAVLLVPAAFSASGPSEWEGWRVGTGLAGRDPAGPFPEAIAVGREADGLLYACRGFVNQDMHVGRIRADFEGCHIGFDGREVEVKPFEVLSLAWKPGTSSMAGALVAGTEWAPGPETPFTAASLFLCRATYQGGVHSGQARAGGDCSFGYGGKRVGVSSYEVLQFSPWLGWVAATSRTVPEGAVVSGREGGEDFFACRAQDRNGLHPGKVKRGPVGCSFVSNGREAVTDRFEVLVPRWTGGHAGTTAVGAFLAGRENGEGQFVCRAQNKDSMQVGKVSDKLKGCHIGMRGAEVVLSDYETLSQ